MRRDSLLVRRRPESCNEGRVTWLTWLIAAVVLTALVAITGAQPKGARPVAGTHLMGVARFVLVLFVAICAYFAFRAYGA